MNREMKNSTITDMKQNVKKVKPELQKLTMKF